MTLLMSRDPPPLTVGGGSERKIRPASSSQRGQETEATWQRCWRGLGSFSPSSGCATELSLAQTPLGQSAQSHGDGGGSSVAELSESEPPLILRAGGGPTRRRH